ncbi:hypothetical protein [Limnoraphis robusta]|uniref:hypothetical protein n=1 Tax=Limnoraphis robusta TaxID=1118279 RepID=UPI002B1EFEA3|nr:hypothetical protein [Limnoraphis robusta]MEA5495997.1 hypothetical protein [Limnoraphis robusta BA-68 BA1]
MNHRQSDFPTANLQASSPQKTVEDLILYIEQNGKYAELVEKAKNPSPSQKKPKKLRNLIKQLQGLVIANPKDFRGRAIVSHNLAKDSKRTACLVTLSSVINAATSFPLLYYAFRDLGVLGVPVTLLVNGLLLKYTNGAATAVSARKPYGRSWSNWAIAGMISINTILSLIAAVGTELLLNPSGLSQLKAQELFAETINRVESLKQLDSPQYKDALTRCEQGEKELNRLHQDHPRRQSLFVQLYGTWEQQNSNWETVPLEELPLCPKASRLAQQAYQNYETAKQELEESLAIRVKMGNDLAFLQQQKPQVYQEHFTPDGELRSGIEATRLAIINFRTKLIQGNWSSLGFHLFSLLVSIITSGPACGMTIALSLRKDTRQSFSETVELQRNIWLETRRQELRELMNPEAELND